MGEYDIVITLGASLLNAGALWYKMGRVEEALAAIKEKKRNAYVKSNTSNQRTQTR